MLKRINIIGVDEQEGDKIGRASWPLSSTNTPIRPPRTARRDTLDEDRYRCERPIRHLYCLQQAWMLGQSFPISGPPEQSDCSAHRAGTLMIGFNGTSRAKKSDFASNPLLQDVNIGWLRVPRPRT